VKDLCSDVLTPDDVPLISNLLSRCTAVVLGPGLGSAPETEDAVVQIIRVVVQQKKPLVIDADAIKPVGEHCHLVKKTCTVVTPHAGEFAKLTGVVLSQHIEERMKMVREWAATLGVTIFLKGPVDVLSDGKQVKLNKVHNEGMTVGGTGDVLAGVIGALLSKGVEPFNAVRIAAFLNGEAGNEAFKKKSYGLLATDIIEEIPGVLKRYL
jgi:NAD(P)H-hydrate epimerase